MEAIKVEDLWFSYPSSSFLFKGLNFSISKGESVAVMGISGSGKTALLKICSALYPLKGWFFSTKGEVIIDGTLKLSTATKEQILEYHSRSGFIFQGAALISNMNAIQNLTLPLIYHKQMPTKEAEKIAIKMLKQTGLKESDFYHRPAQMSIGERKLVGMLRALITEPEFLFIDEPTAELDPSTTRTVKRFLTSYIKGKKPTVMMVSSSPDLIKELTERILFIEDGKIKEMEFESAFKKLFEFHAEGF